MRGRYQIRRKDGAVISARYVAIANVLPGIHVSALSTAALIAELAARSRASRRRPVERSAVTRRNPSPRATSITS